MLYGNPLDDMIDKLFSLSGKTALVTGGSGAIGRACALAFAGAGAAVVIASRKIEDLEPVAEEVRSTGARCEPIAANIARMDDVRSLAGKIEQDFGKVDILVNIAGANITLDSALDIEERAWDITMNLNLKGLFFLSQAMARLMRKSGGGCIINVSSTAGIRPTRLPAYAISKAAVIHVTKVMAREWAQYRIRVNAIAPGIVETPFSQAVRDNAEALAAYLERVPMKRCATTDDLVGTLVYLASDASRFITGVTITIDGGETI